MTWLSARIGAFKTRSSSYPRVQPVPFVPGPTHDHPQPSHKPWWSGSAVVCLDCLSPTQARRTLTHCGPAESLPAPRTRPPSKPRHASVSAADLFAPILPAHSFSLILRPTTGIYSLSKTIIASPPERSKSRCRRHIDRFAHSTPTPGA
jgi:hypothetical protein